ncbi:restriction endonuclease subunit S [Ancylobacter aquaticus]|nr:restriction endonuclease subunit S [Ancylobacter aquaticus]
MKWTQTTLGDVAEIVSGATPKSDVEEYWDGPVAWATPTDLSQLNGKYIGKTARTLSQAGLSSCSSRVLPANSVLFSSRAPIGLVAINTVPMATNQGFKSFIPKRELNPDYLFWWLRCHREQLEDLGNGATFKEVSKAVVSRVPFLLPSIEEQVRIAGILDKADGIRNKREQAIGLVDEFAKSVFLEMFGDPTINEKDLPKKKLRDLGKIVTGNTPPRSDASNFGNAIEWIKSDNINTDEHFLTRATEGLSEEGKNRGRIVPKGSILVTCIAGSPASIGRAAIADRDVAFNQQINAIIPNERVNLYFLYAQFLVGKSLVLKSSTNSMKGMISKGTFQEIEFLCPDRKDQERFGKLFQKHMETTRSLRQDHICANALFGTLSQRAFRGEL